MQRFLLLLACPVAATLIVEAAIAQPSQRLPPQSPPSQRLPPQPLSPQPLPSQPPSSQPSQPSSSQPTSSQPASPQAASSQAAQPSRADQAFAAFAAESGMGDAEAGQLAMQHGASAQVKRLGQQLMTDQTGQNDALQQIADQENLTLPAEPGMMQQAQTRRLNTLYGPEFDKAFVDAQSAQDAREIAIFQKEARSGHDPALKSYAQETLPALRRHLALVQSIHTESTADEGTWHGQD